MQIQLEQNYLEQISKYNESLEREYHNILKVDDTLSRKIVSFQSNKQEPIYRWYKYKEGFSVKLIECLLNRYNVGFGPILDPFAGAGTTIFAASDRGNEAVGIELLQIGQEIIKTRKLLENAKIDNIIFTLQELCLGKPWEKSKNLKDFNILRITKDAYSPETEIEIKKFLWYINQVKNSVIKQLLHFALLCVLESISFTRKDGQYLRWDSRSGRTNGEQGFNKGYIKSFKEAIEEKLNEIVTDLIQSKHQVDLFQAPICRHKGKTVLKNGSCLVELPKMAANHFSGVITSPPYCNRYDYTRTYALELAILGTTEEELRSLRQTMLSCTVENKEKDLYSINPDWQNVINYVKGHELLNAILVYLDDLRAKKVLNNDGIVRMIKGYFYEMACVIYECHRVLQNKGLMIMVNDNVRYAGISIPVDLILSDFAKYIGFKINHILVLPQGKGNSSQQMGLHGREPLRKCVYIWSKES